MRAALRAREGQMKGAMLAALAALAALAGSAAGGGGVPGVLGLWYWWDAGAGAAAARPAYTGGVPRVGVQPLAPGDKSVYLSGSGAFPKGLRGRKAVAVFQGRVEVVEGGAVQWRVACGGRGEGGGYCYADVGGEVVGGEAGGVGRLRAVEKGVVPVYVCVIRNEASDADFVVLQRRGGGKGAWIDVEDALLSYVPGDFVPVVSAAEVAGGVLVASGTGFSGAKVGVSVAGKKCEGLVVVDDGALKCSMPKVKGKTAAVVVTSAAGASGKFVVKL